MKTTIRTLLTLSLLLSVLCPSLQAAETKKEVTEEPASDQAEPEKKSGSSFTEYSLEELMNMDVTTVSKGRESLFETPAAIFVITQEDIRRSGLQSMPDLLRMVPGVTVGRQDSSTWAVGSRGATAALSFPLLVMIDGRSIYNNVFSGVIWSLYDISLYDIERIEVIRGPGGTLWGANAVNGVINIVTKHARDTQKGLLAVGGGYPRFGFTDIRYGASNKSGDINYRFTGKYFYDHGGSTPPEGFEANDQWQQGRLAFRLDYDISKDDTLTITSDFMTGKEAHTTVVADLTTPPYSFITPFSEPVYQGHVFGKWAHTFSEKSDIALQVFYNVFDFNWPNFAYQEHVVDLDFQHRLAVGSWNEFLWGGGYRFIYDNTDVTSTIAFSPENYDQNLFTWFIQDKITLVPDRFYLTIGSKFEHNAFSGFEFQPSGRFLWTPHDKHTLWWAVTRSVKTPNILFEHANNIVAAVDTGAGPFVVGILGNDVTSWKVITAETGYRTQLARWLSLDLTGFFNFYDDVTGIDLETAPTFQTSPVPHTRLNGFFTNDSSIQSYGLELAGNIQIFDWWKLKTGFSWLELDVSVDPDGADPTDVEGGLEENDPRFMAHLISAMDLPHNLELDTSFYFIDDVGDKEVGGNQVGVDKRYRLDVQFAWKPKENLRLSLVGQSLLRSQESEFSDANYIAFTTDVPRSFYGKVTWEY